MISAIKPRTQGVAIQKTANTGTSPTLAHPSWAAITIVATVVQALNKNTGIKIKSKSERKMIPKIRPPETGSLWGPFGPPSDGDW